MISHGLHGIMQRSSDAPAVVASPTWIRAALDARALMNAALRIACRYIHLDARSIRSAARTDDTRATGTPGARRLIAEIRPVQACALDRRRLDTAAIDAAGARRRRSAWPPRGEHPDEILHVDDAVAVDVLRNLGWARRIGSPGHDHAHEIGHRHDAVAVHVPRARWPGTGRVRRHECCDRRGGQDAAERCNASRRYAGHEGELLRAGLPQYPGRHRTKASNQAIESSARGAPPGPAPRGRSPPGA